MSFELRPITPADFPRMVEIMMQQVPEPPTVEQLQKEEAMLDKTPGAFQHRWGAVDENGLLVGYALILRNAMMTEGTFNVNIRVDRSFRRQGIGTALYKELERITCEQHAKCLRASIRESDPAGLPWVQRLGFAQKQHLFESTLDLTSFDPAPFAGAVAAAEASGLRFTSFAEFPQDDAWMQQFLDFWWELMMDVPGATGMTKPTVAMIRQQIEAAPDFWDPSAIILVADGDRWAAIAWLQKQSKGSYYHSLTAVQRDYRGRGLAMAVKVKALEFARSKGAPYVRTHNDSNNTRMLAVNRKMGYRPEPGVLALERSL